MPADKNHSIKIKILKTVLENEWTAPALAAAGTKQGCDISDLKKFFPKGLESLTAFFSEFVTDEALKTPPAKDLRVRDKIRLGVWARLHVMEPYKSSVRDMVGRASPKLVWQAADRIWRMAGDSSTDYNYYTKRILLSGVIASTTLYWMNDGSKNHRKTAEFLERRIENVLKIGQAIGKLRAKAA